MTYSEEQFQLQFHFICHEYLKQRAYDILCEVDREKNDIETMKENIRFKVSMISTITHYMIHNYDLKKEEMITFSDYLISYGHDLGLKTDELKKMINKALKDDLNPKNVIDYSEELSPGAADLIANSIFYGIAKKKE